MRISDWSSDVCSSDLTPERPGPDPDAEAVAVDESPSEHDMSRAPAAAAADPAPAYRRKARRAWSGDLVRNLRLCDGWDRGGQARERYPAGIGSASCRERVCQFVSISVGGVALQKK